MKKRDRKEFDKAIEEFDAAFAVMMQALDRICPHEGESGDENEQLYLDYPNMKGRH